MRFLEILLGIFLFPVMLVCGLIMAYRSFDEAFYANRRHEK